MKMIHPDIDAVAEVVDETVFAQVWAPRGWELLGPVEAYATDILGEPVKAADKLTAEQLKQLVAARTGSYPDASAKKADVLKLLADSFGEQAAEPASGEPDPADPTTKSVPAGSTTKDK